MKSISKIKLSCVALFTLTNALAQNSTIYFTNQVQGKNNGIGMNIEFMQTPSWQTSPLFLNKMTVGVFEHDFNNLAKTPEAEEWKYINGVGSPDRTVPFQGNQCLKFVSNGNNGLVSNQSQFFFESTLPHKFSIALKAGDDFNGTVKIEFRNQYFSNIDNLTTPDITLSKDWKVYTYDLKNMQIGSMVDRKNILIKGSGTVYIDDVKLYTVADDRGDKFAKSAVEKLKEFQPALLRWGAIPANFYNFKESVGIGAPNRFTYGEWIKLCKELGCRPNICIGVNYGTDFIDSPNSTFKLMAEYLTADNNTDGGKIRLSEGINEPLLKNDDEFVLEFGNEVWAGAAHFASFYSLSGQVSVDEYMKFADAGINTLTSVPSFSSIRKNVSIVYSGWSVNAGDSWNLGVINRRVKRPGDQIALSGYLGGNLALENGVPLTDPSSLSAQAEYYKKTIENIPLIVARAAQLKDVTFRSQGKNMPFYFYEGTMTNEKYYGKLGQAVVYTDYIMEMMRNGNLSYCVAFNFTGGQYALVFNENGQWRSKPMFTLAKTLNQYTKGDILTSSILGPQDSVSSNTSLKYPKLSHMITSKDGKTFALMVINRDFNNAQTFNIDLPASGTFSNSASIVTLTANNWNVDKESDMSIITQNINDFSKLKSFTIPKFGTMVINFSGNLNLLTSVNQQSETDASNMLKIYPNPTSGVVFIDGSSNINAKIYNAYGVELINTNSNQLNLSGLSNGVYTIIVSNGNDVKKEKLILTK
jgi:alpha-L-arabinofuranosidase